MGSTSVYCFSQPARTGILEFRYTKLGHMKLILALIVTLFYSSLAIAAAAGPPITLPIEVLGENGTTSAVTVEVPARSAREVRSLWIQIHNLSYPDIVSVQINTSPWFSLNN